MDTYLARQLSRKDERSRYSLSDLRLIGVFDGFIRSYMRRVSYVWIETHLRLHSTRVRECQSVADVGRALRERGSLRPEVGKSRRKTHSIGLLQASCRHSATAITILTTSNYRFNQREDIHDDCYEIIVV
jgi:hypothetical protein